MLNRNDTDYTSEEALNSLDGQTEVNVGPFLYRSFAKTHFLMELQVICNTFLSTSEWDLISTSLMASGTHIHLE
jgi:hypothetical protein